MKKTYIYIWCAVLLGLALLTGCAAKTAEDASAPESTAAQSAATQSESTAPQGESAESTTDTPESDTGTESDAAQSTSSESTENTEDTAESTVEERPLVGNRLIADFTTADIYGNTVDQSLFEGYDVIMMNFWGTFCPPCIEEMPYLGEIAAEYAEKNVLVVGVLSNALDYKGNLDESVLEDARYIVETTGADYTHLIPADGLLPLAQQIYLYPTTVFLNADGYQLSYAWSSALDKAGWSAMLDDLLVRVEEAAQAEETA